LGNCDIYIVGESFFMLVLVVDDSKTIQYFLTESIKAEGHDVISSLNGLDAIEKYKKHPIDLILMDAEMPGCDGFEATKRIREFDSSYWVPLIFLSAHSDNHYIQKALDSGADVYLRKPINDVELHGQIRAMARIAAMSKEVRRLNDSLLNANEELNKYANFDSLTNIANRRNFDQRLEIEIQHSQRQQLPLSVLLADIDFFKQYNDTYGHLAGDSCLQKVAKSLTETFSRKTDLVARYGGEEFVVILPDTSQLQAAILAEKMRANINNLQVEHESSKVSEFVSISIGISTTFGNESYEEILSQADNALYSSKQQGRNRSTVYKINN
jgi:diguanylate cyclase (GGDEF)-like protein